MTTPIKKPATKPRSKKSDVFEKSVATVKRIDQTIKNINAKKATKKKSPFSPKKGGALQLKSFEKMLRDQTTHVSPADLSSAVKFQKSLETFGEIYAILLLTAKDATRLRSAEFINWFDPNSKVEVVQGGNLGQFMGYKVWTDAYLPPDQRFVKNSVFISLHPGKAN